MRVEIDINIQKEESSDSSGNFGRYMWYFILLFLTILWVRILTSEDKKPVRGSFRDKRRFDKNRTPPSGSGRKEVDIKLSESDSKGQFRELAREFNLSTDQKKEIEQEIKEIVQERTKDKDIDNITKLKMSNIMASIIRQEMKQLEDGEIARDEVGKFSI